MKNQFNKQKMDSNNKTEQSKMEVVMNKYMYIALAMLLGAGNAFGMYTDAVKAIGDLGVAVKDAVIGSPMAQDLAGIAIDGANVAVDAVDYYGIQWATGSLKNIRNYLADRNVEKRLNQPFKNAQDKFNEPSNNLGKLLIQDTKIESIIKSDSNAEEKNEQLMLHVLDIIKKKGLIKGNLTCFKTTMEYRDISKEYDANKIKTLITQVKDAFGTMRTNLEGALNQPYALQDGISFVNSFKNNQVNALASFEQFIGKRIQSLNSLIKGLMNKPKKDESIDLAKIKKEVEGLAELNARFSTVTQAAKLYAQVISAHEILDTLSTIDDEMTKDVCTMYKHLLRNEVAIKKSMDEIAKNEKNNDEDKDVTRFVEAVRKEANGICSDKGITKNRSKVIAYLKHELKLDDRADIVVARRIVKAAEDAYAQFREKQEKYLAVLNQVPEFKISNEDSEETDALTFGLHINAFEAEDRDEQFSMLKEVFADVLEQRDWQNTTIAKRLNEYAEKYADGDAIESKLKEMSKWYVIDIAMKMTAQDFMNHKTKGKEAKDEAKEVVVRALGYGIEGLRQVTVTKPARKLYKKVASTTADAVVLGANGIATGAEVAAPVLKRAAIFSGNKIKKGVKAVYSKAKELCESPASAPTRAPAPVVIVPTRIPGPVTHIPVVHISPIVPTPVVHVPVVQQQNNQQNQQQNQNNNQLQQNNENNQQIRVFPLKRSHSMSDIRSTRKNDFTMRRVNSEGSLNKNKPQENEDELPDLTENEDEIVLEQVSKKDRNVVRVFDPSNEDKSKIVLLPMSESQRAEAQRLQEERIKANEYEQKNRQDQIDPLQARMNSELGLGPEWVNKDEQERAVVEKNVLEKNVSFEEFHKTASECFGEDVANKLLKVENKSARKQQLLDQAHDAAVKKVEQSKGWNFSWLLI